MLQHKNYSSTYFIIVRANKCFLNGAYMTFIYKMKLAWYLETTGPVAAPGVLRGAHHGVSIHCTGLTIGNHRMSLNLGS